MILVRRLVLPVVTRGRAISNFNLVFSSMISGVLALRSDDTMSAQYVFPLTENVCQRPIGDTQAVAKQWRWCAQTVGSASVSVSVSVELLHTASRGVLL